MYCNSNISVLVVILLQAGLTTGSTLQCAACKDVFSSLKLLRVSIF